MSRSASSALAVVEAAPATTLLTANVLLSPSSSLVVLLSLVYGLPDSFDPKTLLTTTQNFGSSVGPSIAKALTSSLGANGVAIQGVDYEATIASNIQQGRAGGPVMAKLIKQAKEKCPDTKIALGGYSQGGFVVSNAISSGGVNKDDIAAAVVYGDPSRVAAGGLDKSKVKDYCVTGDGVCAGTFAISAAHLAYTRYVPIASQNLTIELRLTFYPFTATV
jgi:hypothetical protein